MPAPLAAHRASRSSAGTGNVTFNGKPAAEYLGFNPAYVGSVRDPLEILGLEGSYDVIVKAHGGGVMGEWRPNMRGPSAVGRRIDAPPHPGEKAFLEDPPLTHRLSFPHRPS